MVRNKAPKRRVPEEQVSWAPVPSWLWGTPGPTSDGWSLQALEPAGGIGLAGLPDAPQPSYREESFGLPPMNLQPLPLGSRDESALPSLRASRTGPCRASRLLLLLLLMHLFFPAPPHRTCPTCPASSATSPTRSASRSR